MFVFWNNMAIAAFQGLPPNATSKLTKAAGDNKSNNLLCISRVFKNISVWERESAESETLRLKRLFCGRSSITPLQTYLPLQQKKTPQVCPLTSTCAHSVGSCGASEVEFKPVPHPAPPPPPPRLTPPAPPAAPPNPPPHPPPAPVGEGGGVEGGGPPAPPPPPTPPLCAPAPRRRHHSDKHTPTLTCGAAHCNNTHTNMCLKARIFFTREAHQLLTVSLWDTHTHTHTNQHTWVYERACVASK